jgi:ABC-type microcin C transport system permease subunit YejB
MDVSMKYGIYKDRKSARMISSDFRMATGKKIDPEFVHWLAKRKGFTKHHMATRFIMQATFVQFWTTVMPHYILYS